MHRSRFSILCVFGALLSGCTVQLHGNPQLDDLLARTGRLENVLARQIETTKSVGDAVVVNQRAIQQQSQAVSSLRSKVDDIAKKQEEKQQEKK